MARLRTPPKLKGQGRATRVMGVSSASAQLGRTPYSLNKAS
eukprot:CAMPEP_0171744828 /NCGR_PEP_ID=MMETSP0991-20121206/37756_1 /TAXON_ID=483369 /ORGANISM="non described non described, Strain CCMP2098" /LENGTH=40 /DNA_ID= /DNA_START= /DNA_END= /DNA_ORIENTATION=